MPTGYTDAVARGEVDSFPEFAMNCARAFGALVMMRDSPSAEEIPERFEPSDFYAKAKIEAQKELNRLLSLSPEEAAIERDRLEAERVQSRAEYENKKSEQLDRYEVMLAYVDKWVPPTSDHTEMKKFMRDQLVESIKFDCSPSTYQENPLPPAKEWIEQAIDQARQSVGRYTTEHNKEVERTERRNEWLRDLRDSLN